MGEPVIDGRKPISVDLTEKHAFYYKYEPQGVNSSNVHDMLKWFLK